MLFDLHALPARMTGHAGVTVQIAAQRIGLCSQLDLEVVRRLADGAALRLFAMPWNGSAGRYRFDARKSYFA